MAWTTPRTWASAEVPTAAQFNEHIRDNLLVLKTTRDSNGRIYAISSSYFASLDPANLTGLASLSAATNSFTSGRTRFIGTSRLIVPVGADKYFGTKGFDAAGIWVEGDYLHHIADDRATEWRYLGTYVSTPAGAVPGSLWVEQPSGEASALHYIDADGDERFCRSTAAGHSDAVALAGSLWIETYTHWIRDTGVVERVGHADVVHGDAVTHNDHSDHSDSGPHSDSTAHDDSTNHLDHSDAEGFPFHIDTTFHDDHADHSDSGPHTDSTSHTDANPHDDVAADSRPVIV
jgi:hypothetical protein